MPQSGRLNCSFRIASSITSLRNLFHLLLPVRDEAIVFCLCCDSLFVCCVRVCVVHVVVLCANVVCLLCCVVCGVCACLLWLGGGVWVGPWGSGCGCGPVPLPLSVYPWSCCWWGVPWLPACTPGASDGGCIAGRMAKAHHVL